MMFRIISDGLLQCPQYITPDVAKMRVGRTEIGSQQAARAAFNS